MATKTSSLQAALKQNGSRKEQAEASPQAATSPASTAIRSPGREGKKNVSAWLDPGYKRSLMMVRAITDKETQDLIGEALNDLFAKYNVPQVRKD